MICHSIMNIRFTKEASFKYKDNNNDSSMNDQIEDKNDKDCYSVDEKSKKCPIK